ncbi:hypothetical protein PR202_ga27180 [Eleusine coracana subsp. coracana]|uniref:tRNA nucleotidyltransferase/poly(A) polymerase RNA and SrmB- binding domain-containing protein n=1 Tax=Eleusine coracana subsp. coracana TaxID=191504 RepID=A0AAV5DFC0_ELECO|nr:hypothetical protein PR202_ga27180 [Eleusine coracana subsp. coracana]
MTTLRRLADSSRPPSHALIPQLRSVVSIFLARLMLEMNSMLSYGAAESTIRLLTKYGLLDILLPFQAAYISDQMKVRSSDRDLMLMKLLANMDKLLSVNRPGHRILWLALLAFHSALINSPQDAQVFASYTDRLRVLRIFEGLDSDLASYEQKTGVCGSRGIDYKSLKDGDPDEIRFVLGKVIMDIMNEDLPSSVTDLTDRN